MNSRIAMIPGPACLLSLIFFAGLSGTAHAHEGHGLPGISHWHGTDVLGFVAVIAAGAAIALWTNRRK